jgi:ribosomal protein L9
MTYWGVLFFSPKTQNPPPATPINSAASQRRRNFLFAKNLITTPKLATRKNFLQKNEKLRKTELERARASKQAKTPLKARVNGVLQI